MEDWIVLIIKGGVSRGEKKEKEKKNNENNILKSYH